MATRKRRLSIADIPGAPSWAAPIVGAINLLSDDTGLTTKLSDLDCEVYSGLFTHGVPQPISTRLARVGGVLSLGAYEQTVDTVGVVGGGPGRVLVTVWFKDSTVRNCKATVALFPDGVAGSAMPAPPVLAKASDIPVVPTGDAAWTVPTFTNSWVDASSTTFTIPVGYFKDASGFVHLRGTIKSGALSTSAFTLPVGYRPSGTVKFAVTATNAFGQVRVDSTGFVTPTTAVGTTAFSLDGVLFNTL